MLMEEIFELPSFGVSFQCINYKLLFHMAKHRLVSNLWIHSAFETLSIALYW